MLQVIRAAFSALALLSACGPAFAQTGPDTSEPIVLYDGQALVLKSDSAVSRLVPFYCQRVGQEFYVRVEKETAVAVLCPTTANCETSVVKQSAATPVPTLSSPKVCLSGWLPQVIPEKSIPEGIQRIELPF